MRLGARIASCFSQQPETERPTAAERARAAVLLGGLFVVWALIRVPSAIWFLLAALSSRLAPTRTGRPSPRSTA